MKTILVDAVHALVVKQGDSYGVFGEMHKLLEAFPNRKVIVTNADDEGMKKYGLDRVPYEVFTLRHDPEKTDPRYYKMMLAQLGLEAGDAVYFEHSLEAVKSAESVGIATYHYDSEKRDLEGLKNFLVKSLH